MRRFRGERYCYCYISLDHHTSFACQVWYHTIPIRHSRSSLRQRHNSLFDKIRRLAWFAEHRRVARSDLLRSNIPTIVLCVCNQHSQNLNRKRLILGCSQMPNGYVFPPRVGMFGTMEYNSLGLLFQFGDPKFALCNRKVVVKCFAWWQKNNCKSAVVGSPEWWRCASHLINQMSATVIGDKFFRRRNVSISHLNIV